MVTKEENTINNVLVILRTTVFLRTGTYVLFSIEPLGGFDPPIAQTKVSVKETKLVSVSTRSVIFRDCESNCSYFSAIITANSVVRQNRP